MTDHDVVPLARSLLGRDLHGPRADADVPRPGHHAHGNQAHPPASTSPTTPIGSAPNASRIPNSRVRVVTANEITPYSPMHASNSAAPANAPNN